MERRVDGIGLGLQLERLAIDQKEAGAPSANEASDRLAQTSQQGVRLVAQRFQLGRDRLESLKRMVVRAHGCDYPTDSPVAGGLKRGLPPRTWLFRNTHRWRRR